jgi:4-hydroxy-3-methylbut-2-en-1-yl diphosphate synthase IspG/GcpE
MEVKTMVADIVRSGSSRSPAFGRLSDLPCVAVTGRVVNGPEKAGEADHGVFLANSRRQIIVHEGVIMTLQLVEHNDSLGQLS